MLINDFFADKFLEKLSDYNIKIFTEDVVSGIDCKFIYSNKDLNAITLYL